MTRRTPLLILGALATLVIAWIIADRAYLAPRRAWHAQIAAYDRNITTFEVGLERRRELMTRLKVIGDTTLAREPDMARHRLRSTLAHLAEDRGLRDVVVSDSAPRAIANPAGDAGLPRALDRAIDSRRDADVLRGQLRGVGSLAAALDVLTTAQAQPWLHRVEGFSLKPADKNRSTYELRVDVATLLLTDLEFANAEAPAVVPAPEATRLVVNAIAGANPFTRPAPAPAPAVAKQPPAPPQPQEPEDTRWRLVGVVQGAAGVEAWLARTDSNKTQVLAQDAEILGLRLVAADGERAIFEREGARFTLTAGQTLSQRVPAP